MDATRQRENRQTLQAHRVREGRYAYCCKLWQVAIWDRIDLLTVLRLIVCQATFTNLVCELFGETRLFLRLAIRDSSGSNRTRLWATVHGPPKATGH